MQPLTNENCVDILKNLIEIPSLSSEEKDAADFLYGACKEIFSQHDVRRDGNSIIIHVGAKNADHTLLFCSHIDTVSPSDKWTKDPFKATLEGDKLYGLGANDALASCVTMLTALSHIQQECSRNAAFILALVAEEEMGDQGFARIEPQLKYTSAIFGEPTEMKVATAMRGYMRLKLLGNGKSCHASRPWEGDNAIFDLMHQIKIIENLDLNDNSPWERATVQPTLLKAGTTHNQIPDSAEAILDIRPTPAIDNDKILTMLTKNNLRFDIIHNKRRPMSCDENSEVMKAVFATNPDIEKFAFGGTCDMAFSTQPSIVMGPGASKRSHAADEYICLSELKEATEQYKKTMQGFLSLYK